MNKLKIFTFCCFVATVSAQSIPHPGTPTDNFPIDTSNGHGKNPVPIGGIHRIPVSKFYWLLSWFVPLLP